MITPFPGEWKFLPKVCHYAYGAVFLLMSLLAEIVAEVILGEL
jgi:hypothetical protein